MEWKLADILNATAGRLLYGSPQQCFAGIGIDSRTIPAEFVFVAIRGERHDGHAFIREVTSRGVRGVLIEEVKSTLIDPTAMQTAGIACVAVPDTIRALGDLARYRRRQLRIPVLAITGSNGKTTTRQMTTAIVATRFKTLSTQGNLNNEIGLPLTLFDLTREHQAAVLELGMNHPGEIGRLAAICQPTVGLITNVGPAHLEFLGSLEGVAQAKAELIDQIDSSGTLILNADDPYAAMMQRRAAGRKVILFGGNPQAHVRAGLIRNEAEGMTFDLMVGGRSVVIRMPIRGRFLVSNALAAAAAAVTLGIDLADIKVGLEAYHPLQGRMTINRFTDGSVVIDDTYNANPASMQAAIEALLSLKADRPGMIVVGDMLELGEESVRLHRRLGRQAGSGSAIRLYACGPHAGDVADGAREAGMEPDLIFTGAKAEITNEVIRCLTPGTWVLVKGSRGMAMETIVQDLLIHLNRFTEK